MSESNLTFVSSGLFITNDGDEIVDDNGDSLGFEDTPIPLYYDGTKPLTTDNQGNV